ncbi:MAG: metallophosphoesterase [Clostridia bacterium]|nr:metallophosphoesterase [Clostridia bacterium]
MKRHIFFVVVVLISLLAGSLIVSANSSSDIRITLQLNNPIMEVNGVPTEIDDGRGTAPVLINQRTVVPIRAIIESFGGSVDWEEATQSVLLGMRGDIIKLALNSNIAYINNMRYALDVAPVAINGRTMLPIRFIAEGFNLDVSWDDKTQTVGVSGKFFDKNAPLPKPLYSVGILSDVHIQNISNDNTNSQEKFSKALQFFSDYGAKMVCISGDLTDNGTDSEFQKYKEIRDNSSIPVYETTGNHEASSSRTYKSKTDNADCIAYHLYNLIDRDFCYVLYEDTYEGLSFTYNNGNLCAEKRVVKTGLNLPENEVYFFVGILGDANYGLFFQEELQWFKDKLEMFRNKRCYVFEHCRAERLRWDSSRSAYVEDLYSQFVSGNISGKYLKPLWGQADNSGKPNYARIFEKLMAHYTNCVWFHGHTHASANVAKTYDASVGNIDNFFGDKYHPWNLSSPKENTKYSWSVHVSSCAEPRTIKDGVSVAEHDGSEGCIMDVYENKVVVKYVDFINSEIICEYTLKTNIDPITENTYSDSTGLIK